MGIPLRFLSKPLGLLILLLCNNLLVAGNSEDMKFGALDFSRDQDQDQTMLRNRFDNARANTNSDAFRSFHSMDGGDGRLEGRKPPMKGTTIKEDMKNYFENPPRPIQRPRLPEGPKDRPRREHHDDDDHARYFRYRFKCDRKKSGAEYDRQLLKAWVNRNDFRFIDFNLPYENPYHPSFARPLFSQTRPNPQPRLPLHRYDVHLTSPIEHYCDCVDCLYMARYRFPPQHHAQHHPQQRERQPPQRPQERHSPQHLPPRPPLRPQYLSGCPSECRFEMCQNADYFSLKMQVPYTHGGRAWMGDFFWYLGNWYLYDTDRDAHLWANRTAISAPNPPASSGSPGTTPSGGQDHSPSDTYQVEWVPKTWFQ